MAKKRKDKPMPAPTLTDEEGGGEADPELIASWESAEPLVSASIQIAADGTPAGVIAGGSGTSGSGQFTAPGHPEVVYTAAVYGEIEPKACSITEAGGGSGNGSGA
jgi:hypothetical protein